MPNPTSRRARPHSLRRAVLATAALVLGLAAAAPASAANPVIRFGVNIGLVGDCLTLWSTPGETANLVWRDADGALKAQASNESTDGLWFYCTNNLAVEIGDRLKLTDETSTRTFIVPALSVKPDRVNDTFKGTGPAGRTVRVTYAQGLFADVAETRSVRVGQDGKWSFHPRNLDILGGQNASVSWKSPNNDRVTADAIAPFIEVTLDSARVSGYTRPFAVVEVALQQSPSDFAFADARGGAQGAFDGQFRDGSELVPVSPGDIVSAPSVADDADWIVPQIDGAGNAPTDIIDGRCHDAGTSANFVIVDVYRTGHRRGYVISNTEADGSFEFDFREVGPFANPANIKHGDRIVIRCLQVTGDWVQLRFVVP